MSKSNKEAHTRYMFHEKINNLKVGRYCENVSNWEVGWKGNELE